jgi:predicted TIM-barrel fold metal-dependent hydrolase
VSPTAIIDAHAHIFPDKVASKAVKAIGEYYKISMSRDGTVQTLLESGNRIGVSRYIVHSTATTTAQVKAINTFIARESEEHFEFIGFGTLHPSLGEKGLKEEFSRIMSLGLKGIKLHPEFQGFALDDPEMNHLYDVVGNNCPILIHAGDENVNSSSPERLARVLDRFPHLVVIAAHLGGYRMWDLSRKLLVGRNIYLDTSSSLFALELTEAVRIIRAHGVDRVLFGTDYPMWDHRDEYERFMKLGLDDNEREAILWKNAASLLGISSKDLF